MTKVENDLAEFRGFRLNCVKIRKPNNRSDFPLENSFHD
jgi:hypothetical protein